MDSPASTFNPNKRLKEEFVSNLTGTSMMELFLLITTLSMLLFLRSVYSSTKKDVSHEVFMQRYYDPFFICIWFTLLNMACTGISFFTLSAVAILTSMINLPPSYCGILGWFILVVYEVFLLLGLNEYLLSNERGHDIISQNKEGIFSIFGYWGLYLVCVQLGNYLFFGKPGDAVLRTNDWTRIRVWIFRLSTVFLDRHVERVSRRMCNLAYVTVTLAMNLQVFAVLTLADYVPGYKVAALMEVFDRNLLDSFLLANVLTGLVNLSLYTLSVSPFTALAILVGYAYILSIAAAVARFNCIRLKMIAEMYFRRESFGWSHGLWIPYTAERA